jgi:ABC-2 type transport system permease protein
MEILRERMSLFFTILFPSLMVFILGTLLSSMDNADQTILNMRVAYVNETAVTASTEAGGYEAPEAETSPVTSGRSSVALDAATQPSEDARSSADRQAATKAALDAAAVEMFLENLADNRQIRFNEAQSPADAVSAVNSGAANVAVIFHSPLSIEIFEGRDSTKNNVLSLLCESFSRRYAAISASYDMLSADSLAASANTLTQSASTASANTPAQSTSNAPAELLKQISEIPAEEIESYIKNANPERSRSMMDYYAVTMIVMIIFMGGIAAAEDIYNGRRNFTLARSLASPKGRVSYYIQMLLARIPQNIIQVLVVMLVSVSVFGARYADTAMGNVILFTMLFICGMTVSAISTILGTLLKFSPTALIMPITWVFLFVSGTFSKAILLSISEFSPAFIIQKAAFDLTVFGRYEQCLSVSAVAILIFAAATVAGTALFRRKGFSV